MSIFPTGSFVPSVMLAPTSVTFFWIGTASPVLLPDWLVFCIVWLVDLIISYIDWFIPSDCANAETRVNIDDKVNAVVRNIIDSIKNNLL